MDYSLTKEERIHKRDEINRLFEEGKSFLIHPFKVQYLSAEPSLTADVPIKFAASIPKKNFKKAVDRNALKRKSKEAFRLHRNELKQHLLQQKKCVFIMLIYIDRKAQDYAVIEDKIILILRRLQAIYAEDCK